jgi:hypothetical protein
MVIYENGSSGADVVVAPDSSELERHAAAELVDYLEAISGNRLTITETVPSHRPIIAVGKAARAYLRDPVPEGDEFVVQSTSADDRDVLAILGGSDRATLWAVYAFLQDVLGVGFFRDGEYVPSQPTIEIEDTDIHETPRFPVRSDGNGCIYTYTTSAWGWDDWKYEIDWRAKHRITEIWPPNVGGDVQNRVLADWGIDTGTETQRDEGFVRADATLHEQIRNYARSLGMRVPIILPTGGGLPDAFYNANPDVKALTIQWSEYEPHRLLHPSDPHLRRLISDYIRIFSELHGTDHLYIAEFTSESRVLGGEENIQDARETFVRAVSDGIAEADPDGVWLMSSWSFDIQEEDPSRSLEQVWTKDDVHGYIDAATVPVVINDLWSEEAEKYRRLDHFWDHKWGFGVLHSFGAGGFIHGDVGGLIDRSHKLISDPRANKCVEYNVQSEMIDFNSFYYELAARLAWDPSQVTLDGYISEYCRLRYGTGAEHLHEAYCLLSETAFGPESGTVKIILDPLYWFRPDLDLLAGWPEDRAITEDRRTRRPEWLPKMQRAAELFASDRDLLARSKMAVRDLVDVTRQIVAERFSIELVAARDAFLASDGEKLESVATEALRLLDYQTKLLSSWPAYRLDVKVERHRHIHGDDSARAVKHRHVWVSTNESQHSVPLRDYFRQDLDESVAGYYKPRVEAFLDLLRVKLSAGDTSVAEDELDRIYTPIEEGFIAAIVPSHPERDPIEASVEVLCATK